MRASLRRSRGARAIIITAAITAMALMVCAAAPLGAQPTRPLRVGETVSAALTAADPVLTKHGPFHVYRIQAAAGERLVATMRSGAFDSMLTLLRPVGGITEHVAEDDDGAGGRDARLRWAVPVSGEYLLVAHAFSADGLGGYTLALEAGAPEQAATPQAIRPGETRQGVLSESSGLLHDGAADVRYELYVFDALAGQRFIVSMESEDFDSYIAFGPLRGATIDVSDTDDDGGAGNDARLRVVIPADGRYGIMARAYGAGTGRFLLTLREPTTRAARPIERGRQMRDALGVEEEHDWLYAGRAGETLRISMTSDEFDTVLQIGTVVDGTFRLLEQNDDADDGTTNSLLMFTLPDSATYVIRAQSYHAGAGGAYVLRIN